MDKCQVMTEPSSNGVPMFELLFHKTRAQNSKIEKNHSEFRARVIKQKPGGTVWVD